MQSDYLIFELDRCNHFDAFKTFMFSSKNLFNLRFTSNLVFIKLIDLLNQFTSFTQNSNRFKKSTLKKTLNFKSNNSFISLFNVVTKKSISFKSLNKSKTSTNIVMIDVIIFYKLNFWKSKTANVKSYFMIMFEINDALTIYRVKNDLKVFLIKINEMSKIFIKKFSLKEMKTKLHFDFYDLLQTFDLITIENLLFHHFYNHKIDFINDSHTMQSQIYSLFFLKLMKLKKYLKKISKRILSILITFRFSHQYYLSLSLTKNFVFASIIANLTLLLNAIIILFFSSTKLWLNSLNINTSWN